MTTPLPVAELVNDLTDPGFVAGLKLNPDNHVFLIGASRNAIKILVELFKAYANEIPLPSVSARTDVIEELWEYGWADCDTNSSVTMFVEAVDIYRAIHSRHPHKINALKRFKVETILDYWIYHRDTEYLTLAELERRAPCAYDSIINQGLSEHFYRTGLNMRVTDQDNLPKLDEMLAQISSVENQTIPDSLLIAVVNGDAATWQNDSMQRVFVRSMPSEVKAIALSDFRMREDDFVIRHYIASETTCIWYSLFGKRIQRHVQKQTV
jgi:hypothetical protein